MNGQNYNPAALIQAAYRMRMPPAVKGIRAVMRKGKQKRKYSAAAVAHNEWDKTFAKHRAALADVLYKASMDKIEDHYAANVIGGIPVD